MQLPVFFGHKKAINLLPKDSFESSTLGIILDWALAFGKWAVIVTQLVVMVVFLWRFTLDRQLTDLRKQIEKESNIIASYKQLEEDFVLTQRKIDFAKPVLAKQVETEELLQLLQSLMPTDVWLEKLAISPTSISFTAYSASLNGFSGLLTSLQREPRFSSISIGKVENGGAGGALLKFDITLSYAGAKK